MAQSTLSIVTRISQTIALLIFLAAYVHSYTGNYCTKDKSLCFQLNPNGKAEIVVDKVSIIGSYVKTGDNFLVTAKTAANQASKDLIVKKVKKSLEWTLDESFDSDLVWKNCNRAAENSIRSNNSTFLGDGKLYGVHEVAKCVADAERKWNQQKPQAAAANKKYLKELKYNDDLLKVFVGGFDFLVFLVSEGLDFTLIGNTLHLPNTDCGSALALTKLGFKESAFNDADFDKQFCVNNIVYNKCGGEIYKPDKQGCCGGAVYDSATQICENNTLLLKCGNSWYDEKKQFCSSGNIVKDYGKLTDSRDGKTYKTVAIGTQTWMAENLNYNANDSKCYDNKPANCDKYGRLYDWNAAMKACPSGWHLPSDAEWQTLVNFAGGKEIAGNKLNSSGGWHLPYWSSKATDEFGFSALPGGYGDAGGSFYKVGGDGHWWSSSEYNANNAYKRSVSGGYAAYNYEHKRYLFGVRCVQGDPKDMPKQSNNDTKNLSNVAKPSSEGIKTQSNDVKTFKDPRDGKEYKFVKIGKQTWMAENLNYNASDSKCYKNNETNCKKYGRLYDWNSANKACPEGWHLPSDDEWTTLTDFIGNGAGTKLKTTSGWSENGNGTNDFGFSALPSGIVRGGRGNFEFIGIGQIAYLRSSTSALLGAKGRSISDEIRTDISLNGSLLSVRCVQN